MNLISNLTWFKALLAAVALTTLIKAAESVPQVALMWDDNSETESGFRIERSESNKPFVMIASVGANVTTYYDRSVALGVEYSYRVRAYNAFGESTPTNVVPSLAALGNALPPSNVAIGISLEATK